ncbi:hypothetical protein L208DRAFT_1279865 [Tricholoma matsutake]|nr:hypothetical protein L208DRAFT_1279865 [Tricholoma matsutake 945]
MRKRQVKHCRIDKCVNPNNKIFPLALAVWCDALVNFDPSKAVFTHEGSPIDIGYIFPEPAMFIHAQTNEQRDTYFKSWLKYCTAFIYHAISGTSVT